MSFGGALCDQLGGQPAAGTGRVLVGADHGRVRADRPLRAFGFIAPGPQPVQDLLPGAVQRPAPMPPVDGLPVPVRWGQVTSGAPGPGAEQDPIDYGAVVVPAVFLPRMRGQQQRPPVPLLTGQGMTIQAFIHPERSTPAWSEDLRDTP